MFHIQEINKDNMNVELVAQMFKNYQSNVLFHLEGMLVDSSVVVLFEAKIRTATDSLKEPSWSERGVLDGSQRP